MLTFVNYNPVLKVWCKFLGLCFLTVTKIRHDDSLVQIQEINFGLSLILCSILLLTFLWHLAFTFIKQLLLAIMMNVIEFCNTRDGFLNNAVVLNVNLVIRFEFKSRFCDLSIFKNNYWLHEFWDSTKLLGCSE